ncbi:MAG: FkbM family methyltransferase [Solirubrobacteraceae bacterium]
MIGALRRSWRTWAYGLLSYLGGDRVRRLGSWPGGRVLLALVQRRLAGGYVRVAGGAAGHLKLSSDHLEIDHQQGYGLVRGVLEPGVQEALRRHVRGGAVVYDVGANIGFFTILSARLTGPSGRVEAFEPVPASAAAIAANAAVNRLANVGTHTVAVGERAELAELLVTSERSWSHLAERGFHRDTRERLRVPVVVLDELIAAGALPAPDVVKIDVEGSEIAVLRGLQRTLRARAVTIICELHETGAELLELLDELGYEAENLDGTDPVANAGAIHVLARRIGPAAGRW